MISPLLPGTGTSRGVTDAGTAQFAQQGRAQGRALIEVSATPANMPAMSVGEQLSATVAERLPDGKLSALIKGEQFLLTLPGDNQLSPGSQLALRVASQQPLTFALLDVQEQDAAARLALSQEETPLQTLQQPASKLPSFQAGEWVNARVAERLPDGSAVVLAKNAAFTLQAPPGSKALNADPLLLRVRSTDPVVSFVQVALEHEPDLSKSTPVSLSDATRYLSSLLQAAGPQPGSRQSATAAAVANAYAPDGKQVAAGSKALLQDPSQPGLAHTDSLRQTVEKSGVFYEAHQKAWVDGRLSLEELRQEPQARIGDSAGRHGEVGQLVQRQLDTLEQRQFVYNGLAWPGQQVQWQIQADDTQEREASGKEEMRAWHTQLNLQLPALGGLAARLRMVGNQVQVVFNTDSDATGSLIDANRQQLIDAMEAAGLSLASLQVKHETTAS
ncbi:flagellar hook-length control protein FliK [Vogesella sp. LIG4]|uniref:flagellar hook-length control protein FliK n=1 Tax=Vogesella sp. LIG4 TaxID=1192162 RepID=UPI000820229D|nr:flagellar hook-length control protein FliK [Vogesella sp. LIG4]SCK16358.1 hook-length control protein FliK [Vogesella sp. LIG4]